MYLYVSDVYGTYPAVLMLVLVLAIDVLGC